MSASDNWSARGLAQLAASFVGQESVGTLAGLILRLARYLGGDPAFPVNVTSTGTLDPHGLPDATTAQSAVLHVQGRAIVYTVDGTVPAAATGAQVAIGSIITLTGLPTIRAFQFCSAVAAPAQVTGFYYD